MDAVGPWPAPDSPHLRQTRFRELDTNLFERWTWEAGGTRWRYAGSFVPPTEEEAKRLFRSREEVGPEEWAHIEARARELAAEHGW